MPISKMEVILEDKRSDFRVVSLFLGSHIRGIFISNGSYIRE